MSISCLDRVFLTGNAPMVMGDVIIVGERPGERVIIPPLGLCSGEPLWLGRSTVDRQKYTHTGAIFFHKITTFICDGFVVLTPPLVVCGNPKGGLPGSLPLPLLMPIVGLPVDINSAVPLGGWTNFSGFGERLLLSSVSVIDEDVGKPPLVDVIHNIG